MGSGHVEVHTWTCGDSGGDRERMCLELLNNDWSDPCTGTCQGVARPVFLFGVLCWDSALTFRFWLFAYGVKVLTLGLCLVTDPLSNSEYHHQGTKSYAVPSSVSANCEYLEALHLAHLSMYPPWPMLCLCPLTSTPCGSWCVTQW